MVTLVISNNDALTSLEGLDVATVGRLWIDRNDNLCVTDDDQDRLRNVDTSGWACTVNITTNTAHFHKQVVCSKQNDCGTEAMGASVAWGLQNNLDPGTYVGDLEYLIQRSLEYLAGHPGGVKPDGERGIASWDCVTVNATLARQNKHDCVMCLDHQWSMPRDVCCLALETQWNEGGCCAGDKCDHERRASYERNCCSS